MSVRNTVKSIQDIMRQDSGVDGDAQRISQLCWMFFLKIIDDQDLELEAMQKDYRSPIPKKFQWRTWAANPEGITGNELMAFVNDELFPSLKELSGTAKDARRPVGRGKDRVHPESAIPVFQQIHKESTGEQITVREGRRLFDLKDLCDKLGLSRSLVYSYISEEGDRIPKVKEGKRWLFPEEAVESFKRIRKTREDRKKRRVEGLYSIRDLSRILEISESTLHQYKRRFADRIPSVGTGRDRKYPAQAVEVFRSLRGGGPGSGKEGCYSLSQVSEQTGIPTHTLLYYRRTYPDRIPVAQGRRSRVYTDESIEAFRRLRSRPGRRGH